MENDILNKCITQGNNLVQVCTGLHQRLIKVEEQNKKLIELNTALLKRVIILEGKPKAGDTAEFGDLHERLVELENAFGPEVISALSERVVKLEQVITDMPEKLDFINKTVAQIEAKVLRRESADQYFDEHPEEVKRPEPAKRTRSPRTYETYQKIMKAQSGGMSMKLIAKEMDIPYTTVVSYFKLSQDEIDALPRENKEPEDAEVSQSV